MNEFIIKDGVLIQYNGFDSEITIPNDVRKIENKTFYRCNFLTKIMIPNTVIEIGEYAFADCYDLEFVKFSEKLVSIGKYAFANTKVREIEVPESVTKIEDGVFYGCSFLESVLIFANINKINRLMFYKCYPLSKVIIPNDITKIEEYAFADCYELKDIKLPENLSFIGKYAFANTKLKQERIDFKENCFIEDTAFYGCEDSEEEYLESVAKSEAFLAQKINPWQFIDVQSEQILKLSKEIVGNLKTDYEKARAISEWIVKHIKYDDYRKTDRKFSSVALEPEDVLARGCTVCEGYARLTKALLCAIHIPTLHMIGHLKGQESVWHAWNVSFVDGHWIWLDNANGIKNFDMPTKIFARTHILDGGVKVTVDNTVAVDKLTEIFGYEEC